MDAPNRAIIGELANRDTGSLRRGIVEAVLPGDGVLVSADSGGEAFLCEVLDASEIPLRLRTGHAVLFLLPADSGDRGVVIGRLGNSAVGSPEEGSQAAPEEVLIEAKSRLTLRVGDGSITLREDGKILIKGKDLVSQAKRRNRIRGGSVEIN